MRSTISKIGGKAIWRWVFPPPSLIILARLRDIHKMIKILLHNQTHVGLIHFHHPSPPTISPCIRKYKNLGDVDFLFRYGVEKRRHRCFHMVAKWIGKSSSYQGFSTRKFPVYKLLTASRSRIFFSCADLTVRWKIQKVAIEP